MSASRILQKTARAARPSLVAKFLLRESPASIPSSSLSTLLPFASASNPFLPTKSHPDANSWTAPRYSIRRQKALQKEVALLGLSPDVLPPSAPAKIRSTTSAPLIKASAHIPKAGILNEAELEKRGPYLGRRGAAFKGKVWERNLEARKVELKKALEGADAKIAAWRKTTRDEKAKKTPAPF
ncbi:large subunit ribosomal protein L25, partial [Phenoliferia sp. Uapishka_3]